MSGNAIITLEEKHFIASGLFCECYEHPFTSSECIKIATANKKSNKRLQADLKYYRKLHKKKIDLKYIADFLGVCNTSLGEGFRYECVRDGNGNVSKRLDHYLDDPEVDNEELYRLLKELALYLVRNHVLISDIHPRNILIQFDKDGVMTPMIVDGIGDRVSITILNVFSKLLEAKIIRRWNRFAVQSLESNALLTEGEV